MNRVYIPALMFFFVCFFFVFTPSVQATCFVCDGGTLRKAGDQNDCKSDDPDCAEGTSEDERNACTSEEDVTKESCGGPVTAPKEEQAVYNFNQALIPTQAVKQPEKDEGDLFKNAIKGLLGFLNNLFSKQLFYERIKDGPKLYAQSDTISQSSLPDQVRPDPATNQNQLLPNEAGYLGRNDNANGNDVGFYRSGIPSLDSDCFKNQDVKNCEKLYNQANYPAGIPMVVPQSGL
jgi:hypothetical protein